MSLSYRSRNFYKTLGLWKISEDAGKTWKGNAPTDFEMGSQTTGSEGHSRTRDGHYSGGGPFYTSRLQRDFPMIDVVRKSGSGNVFQFKASLGTPMPASSLPAGMNYTPKGFRSTDTSGLDPLGATAISLTAPTNPNSELGTALAELHREGLPSLPGVHTWKRRTEIARAAGSEFLNTEFGWLPLVNDVLSVGNTVRNSRDILKQYRRDSGRNVRRSFEFPIEESTQTRDIANEFPATHYLGGNNWGSLPGAQGWIAPLDMTQSIKVTTSKWFKGAFTYCVPDRSDSWSNVDRIGSEADQLFGISLTPDVLWELTPWSWAVDWFSNTGHVINNVTNFANQGLVMRYGYMMEEHSMNITNSGSPVAGSPVTACSPPPSHYNLVSKVRRGANPFGFGISVGGLSATQIAIAAALGISLL
jgi:hypothetical protein